MNSRDFKLAQGVQIRSLSASAALRDTGDEFAIAGYSARFGVLSHNLGNFREMIQRGAFTRSLREGADVRCLFNHAPANVLGRTKSGTLTLAEDDYGLRFRCQLNRDSQFHRDLYESIRRGDCDEMSFACIVPDDGDEWQDGLDPETGEKCAFRTLKNVDLIDVAPCVYPAYPSTTVGARSQRSRASYSVETLSDAEWKASVRMRLAQIFSK